MYDFLLNSYYKNIPWVLVIPWQKQWPNIGVFAITHGNEPIWLEIIRKIYLWVQNKDLLIEQWNLYCIAVSIETYKQYKQQDDFRQYRFLDYNMNRIYKKYINSWYEYHRFEELKNIFDEIDIAIDIHSIAKQDYTMTITNKNLLSDAKHIFSTDYILSHKDLWSIWSMIWYLLDRKKIAFWIECWNHLTTTWWNIWYDNVMRLLSYYNMLRYKSPYNNKENMQYFEFIEEIFPISTDFDYIKNYNNFDHILHNEIYAKDWKKEYVNNFWEDIYIWLIWKKTKVWDGNWFLFKKI